MNDSIMIPEDEIKKLRDKNIYLETKIKKLENENNKSTNLLKEILKNEYKSNREEFCLVIVSKIQKHLFSKDLENNKPLTDEKILNK